MLDFKDRKDLLVLLIIGVLVVVAIMIFSLIMIWMPKEEKEEFYVGSTNNIMSVSDEYKVESYLNKISELLISEDYEKLYNYLNPSYIEFSGMDVAKLEQKCKTLKIDKQKILLENFVTKKIKDYNNIFIVTAVGIENGVSVRITINEKSPRQFEIAFDDFVLLKKPLIDKKVENIQFQILQIKYTSTEVMYELAIKNNNSKNININCNNKIGAFMLDCGNDENLTEINSQISIENYEVLANGQRIIKLYFNIEDIDFDQIRSLILRDVKLSDSRVTNISLDI